MTNAGTRERAELEDVQRRRESLHAAMVALEAANSGPADADWSAGVLHALEVTSAVLRQHVDTVEADDGLFVKIANDAPHVMPRVETLRHEHADLLARTQSMLETCRAGSCSADDLREGVLALVTALSRHRHRGADLIYEAYQVDVSAAD